MIKRDQTDRVPVWRAPPAGATRRRRVMRMAAQLALLFGAGLLLSFEISCERFSVDLPRTLVAAMIVGLLAWEAALEGWRFRRGQQSSVNDEQGAARVIEARVELLILLLAAGCVGGVVYLRVARIVPPGWGAIVAMLAGSVVFGVFLFVWDWQPGLANSLTAPGAGYSRKRGASAIVSGLGLPVSTPFWLIAGLASLAFVGLGRPGVTYGLRLMIGGVAILLLPGYLSSIILLGDEARDGAEILCEAFYLTLALLPVILASAGSLGIRFTAALVVAVLLSLSLILGAWLWVGQRLPERLPPGQWRGFARPEVSVADQTLTSAGEQQQPPSAADPPPDAGTLP